jgi:DNA-directed RNA polymerase sigma subunit (sigma70/sigma32)|mmetsp:Transcript_24704/g.66597  ORF Transcript_24704/g.66597 Transcript_24704/m.66597 type:complete len:80 (+) Transcript_24704:2090-2329(+)
MLRRDIDAAMASCLTEREQRVIRMRYGLDDGICRSQRECGLALGMSRANVQNVCHKAFRKLQDTPAGGALFEYMDGSGV